MLHCISVAYISYYTLAVFVTLSYMSEKSEQYLVWVNLLYYLIWVKKRFFNKKLKLPDTSTSYMLISQTYSKGLP